MGTRRAIASVATALALALTGCGSEDVDPGAVPGVDEASGEAQAEAEEALANLRAEAEEAADQLQTDQAPAVKQELLDRCQDALESLREAGSEATDSVEQVCDRIQDADVTDMDLWSEIRQQIEDLQAS